MQHSDPRILQPPLSALTTEEAKESDILDALPPFDDSGNIGWIFEGEPTSARERRWLELYLKLSAGSPISSRAKSWASCPQL
jgi:hypothetical protein